MVTQSAYGLTKELDMPYDEALERVKDALKSEGFGVLTEIDVKDTLEQKLQVDFRRYQIIGACNPALAQGAPSRAAGRPAPALQRDRLRGGWRDDRRRVRSGGRDGTRGELGSGGRRSGSQRAAEARSREPLASPASESDAPRTAMRRA